MIRTLVSTAVAAAALATAMVPAAAVAQDYDGYRGYGWHRGDDRARDYERERAYRHWQHERAERAYYGYDRGGYARGGYYQQPAYNRGYYQQPAYGGGYYRESYQQGYRCRNDGTTGTIVGAIAGGLIGNGVAGRGDRALGTVLGGGAGALAGRAIDRDGSHRC